MKKDMDYYKALDIIAKGFYGMAFRNGPLEDYHAEGCSIGDKEMEVLNRFGFNRLGYLLDLLISGETDKLFTLCQSESLFLSYFDPLDLESEEVKELEKSYELIMKIHGNEEL